MVRHDATEIGFISRTGSTQSREAFGVWLDLVEASVKLVL